MASLPQFPTHSNCNLVCGLREGVTHVGLPSRHAEWSLPPSINTPAVLFVGQNPGLQEDRNGMIFVGPTGQLAKTAYIGYDHPQHGSVGSGIFKRATVYLGNVARCGTWGEIQPTKKQYGTCSHYLLQDILLILPTCSRLLIVMMGAPSIEHTYKMLVGRGYGVKAAADRSGEVVTVPSTNASVQLFSTYHPAYVLRKNAVFSAVMDHLRLVVDSLDGISATPSQPTIVSTTDLLKIARSLRHESKEHSSGPSGSQALPGPSPQRH